MKLLEEAPRAGLVSLASLLLLFLVLTAPFGEAPAFAEGGTPAAAGAEGSPATGGPPAEGPVHVYTNADLVGLPPIPTQKAPLVETPGWDFVFSVLDRERELEERRKDRDLAQAAIAAREARETPRARAPYLYPGFPGFIGLGVPGAGSVVRVPVNRQLSLEARGIRTAVDLFNESVGDSRMRRQSLP